MRMRFCGIISREPLAHDVVLPHRMKPILALLVLASPALAEPRAADLPTADLLSPYIRQHLGATATAGMRVCIAADGDVTSVTLLYSSRDSAFDRAVMTDVPSWRYAPARDAHCSFTRVAYHMR